MGNERFRRLLPLSLFSFSILCNLLLIIGPSLIPDKAVDRVIASATLTFVVGIGFALEDFRRTLKERDEHATLKQDGITSALNRANEQALVAATYEYLREIEDTGDSVFYTVARQIFVKTETRLRHAAAGRIDLDNLNTASLGFLLAKDVRSSLDATVVWPDDPMSPDGRRQYLQYLSEAIATRKVEIRRLFIVEPGTENSTEFRVRVKCDLESRTTVRFLYAKKWVADRDRPYPVDFGVWDASRVWMYDPRQAETAGDRVASLLRDDDSLRTYRSVFEANWQRGTPLTLDDLR